MTDNELIAEWLDWKLGEDTLLRWNDCITCGKPTGERFVVFSPEADINLWHGKDGIISEIVMEGAGMPFAEMLIELSSLSGERIDCALVGLASTPAQLTEALVTMIKEEE